MKIAIVILNWNGKDLLDKFLPEIIRYSDPRYCDIYVADNASTDDSIQFIQQNFGSVKIIKNEQNYGFAKGYNQALKNVNADIFALVNSDIEVTKNWIEPIIDSFKKEENTAVIQPKILDYKSKSKFEYAGAAGGFIDKYGYPFCRGRVFETIEKDTEQYQNVNDLFWASGACFFIRSTVFKELNGFDDTYFAHQEEIDLCWRVKNKKYDIKYVGESTVYHVGGATLHESSPKKTFLNFRNSLFNLIKNAPSKNLFFIIFARLILDGVAGVKFLIQLKPLHTIAVAKAHFSFYYYINKILKNRRLNPVKSQNYYATKSIVWQYFIKKKKTFNEIDRI